MPEYIGVSRYFEGLRYAFMFRVDDFMLAASEYKDNYGGGFQVIDYSRGDSYYTVRCGSPEIVETSLGRALLLSDKDYVVYELAPSPEDKAYVEVSFKTNHLGSKCLFKIASGCESESIIEAGVKVDGRVLRSYLKPKESFKTTVDEEAEVSDEKLSIKLALDYKNSTIEALLNNKYVFKAYINKWVTPERLWVKNEYTTPALVIEAGAKSRVFIYKVESNVMRVWFDNNYYKRYTKTILDLANKYGVRIVWGVITRGYRSRVDFKPDPNTIKLILENKQHEYATHTSYHLHAPPSLLKGVARRILGRRPSQGYRDYSDVLNSIRDLDSILEKLGSKVVTHIYPYGEESSIDWKAMSESRVPVGLDTCEKLKSLEDIRDWKLVCRTGKISEETMIDEVLREVDEVRRSGGVALYMTHAHNFDWNNKESMIRKLEVLFKKISSDNEAWITTPGELYSYIEASKNTIVSKTSDKEWIVEYEEPQGRIMDVMLTLAFKLNDEEEVLGVYKNDAPLEKSFCRSMSNCREHYRVDGKIVYVTIKPSGKDVIRFEAPATP